jgi:hypothetical protein
MSCTIHQCPSVVAHLVWADNPMHTSMCDLGYLFPISRSSDQSQQYQVVCQRTILITKPIFPVTLALANNK